MTENVVFCGNLLGQPAKQKTQFPPHCNAMQVSLDRVGKGTKPTLMLNWELTIPGSNLALGNVAVCGHMRNCQPCRWRWLHPKCQLGGLGAAAGYWTWLQDLSPRGACGKAAGPDLVSTQRDCMETGLPKILLRHFQAPVFS